MANINEMGVTGNYEESETIIGGIGDSTVVNEIGTTTDNIGNGSTSVNGNSTIGKFGYDSTVLGGNTTASNIGNGSVADARTEFKPVKNALPVKTGFWSKVKAFLFQEIDWNKEIKVELTPYQQKVEDEINEFLHQEITWSKVKSFLFKEIKF